MTSLERQIVDNCRRGHIGSRFAIYANNRMVALRGALEQNFPTLVNYSGYDAIRPLLREYCQRHPPDSPYLVFYGEGVSRFLRTFGLPIEADIAALDRGWLSALMAPDAKIVTPEAISDVSQVSVLRLNPSFHVSSVSRDNLALWHSLNSRSIEIRDADISRRTDILFYRDDVMRVHTALLSDPQSLFLECLFQGMTIEQAAERIVTGYPEFSLSEWFASLLVMGAFCHGYT